MPPRKTATDSRNQALVKKAIDAAQAAASDDATFVRLLRASYFAQHPDARAAASSSRGGAASIGGIRAVGGIRDPEVDPIQSVFDDPRYQKRARALAERTRKNTRIIGGQNTASTAFPDCVAVGSASRWGCSGTLIAPNVVLSAGHCAKVATRVYFGTDVRKKGNVVKVSRRVQHPDYHTAKQNDLLLLILEKSVKVKPRRLAPTATISKATEGRAVGFGHIDFEGSFGYGTKREVDVPIVTASCTGKVNGKSDAAAYGCDRELEFVAGKPMLNRDSCSGDSGGPLYVQHNGAWLLAGATSRATKASVRTCGDGGVYVRVDRYRDWIEKTAGVKLK